MLVSFVPLCSCLGSNQGVCVCGWEREALKETQTVCVCVSVCFGGRPLYSYQRVVCMLCFRPCMSSVCALNLILKCPSVSLSVLCLCFSLCLCIVYCGVSAECCRCCGFVCYLPVPLKYQFCVCVLWLLYISYVTVCHVLCLCFVWFYLFKQSGIRLPKVLLHLSNRWSLIHFHSVEERSSKCNKAAGKFAPDDSFPLMISPQILAPPCSHVKFLNLLFLSPYCSHRLGASLRLPFLKPSSAGKANDLEVQRHKNIQLKRKIRWTHFIIVWNKFIDGKLIHV